MMSSVSGYSLIIKVAIYSQSLSSNKTITTGGGGMILTNDESLAKQAKHLTTQAKTDHPWKYHHDAIGYNYRMRASRNFRHGEEA